VTCLIVAVAGLRDMKESPRTWLIRFDPIAGAGVGVWPRQSSAHTTNPRGLK
jgi:hypothetical protein